MIIKDEQFLQSISYRFRNFKKTGPAKYNFSCPFCGDSKKDTRKARGWFNPHKDSLLYHCFNCGASRNMFSFLKEIDPNLYKQYVFEKFGERKRQKPAVVKEQPKVIKTIDELSDLELLNKNNLSHEAVKYLRSRQLPFEDLYWTPSFKKYANKLVPGTFDSEDYDQGRIVIPFRDMNKKIIAIQGRAIHDTRAKYLTVKLSPDNLKIYGLNRIDPTKTVYVTEGAFDALLLPNAISVNGSDFDDLKLLGINDFVIVLDNDPRNPNIVQKYKKYIKNKNKIVIWSSDNKYSDPNDMMVKGHRTLDDIISEIHSRVFFGLRAELEVKKWKKI